MYVCMFMSKLSLMTVGTRVCHMSWVLVLLVKQKKKMKTQTQQMGKQKKQTQPEAEQIIPSRRTTYEIFYELCNDFPEKKVAD